MSVADLMVRNGRVHTVDPVQPQAEAVAVRAGRIMAVGSDRELAELVGPATTVLDAAGGSVLPGFVDAHNHVRLGASGQELELYRATSLADIRSRIGAHLRAHPDLTWVEGVGWNYAAVPGGSPTADQLDGATGGRPAFLFSYDSHTVWLNHEAIQRFGITRDSDRLAWGTVDKHPQTGQPTGWIHDFAVYGISEAGQRALAEVVPGYHPQVQYRSLLTALAQAAGYGITTVVEPQNGLDDVAMFVRARDEGLLRSRLVAAMLALPGTDAARLDVLARLRTEHDDDRLRVGPVKLYIDDVIEPHTAAMLEPYANHPGRGDTFWPPDEFADFLIELERRGFQAFTHATGDRGIRTVLDAVQHCREVHGPRDARHQIVHVECVHPDDLGRFGELGVVACMQPRHCAPDIVAQWRANVGPQRERYAWPFASIAAKGGVLAFSSDWNVAEMDPMTWLYTAVTRADLSGAGGWNLAESIDLATAVQAATLGSAYSIFAERDRGSLSPGKHADLVVLSRDLFEPGDPLAILDTSVTATFVAGEQIHGDAT